MKANDQLEPTVFVIFGGAGDLAWRKLIPALFDLRGDGRMLKKFAIIAVEGESRVHISPGHSARMALRTDSYGLPRSYRPVTELTYNSTEKEKRSWKT